ncbi:MAG: SGNH/GDSL hydrolase family protein [Lachnospiraceae bacterium]|nr:SGNH/GDSL hydrolase family protein [Ruminococcus sp.]MCM1275589.1 SGNH/GDSL hydrolase family protein [Lachnospiraceae bacterium]
MKKLLIGAAMLLTMLSGSAPKKYGSLTVVGDSIASGYGLSEYVSGNNYSALDSFGSLLGAESAHYENFAADGRRSDELLSVLSDDSAPLTRSASEADSVIISIGGNDFLKPMLDAIKTQALTDTDFFLSILEGDISANGISEYSNGILQSALTAARAVDVNATVGNIRRITERIKTLNPAAQIVLLTVYNPFSGNVLLTAASEAAEEKLSELNGGIKALADDTIVIADVYGAFKGHEAGYTNINRLDIHPSSAGHHKIYETLSEILPKATAAA